MSRYAFTFPGVGVRFCGQERDFYLRHEGLIRPMMEQASEVAHCDLLSSLRAGETPALGERADQLFTTAFNCCVAAVYSQEGIEASLMAGHSLGLYAALVASGALTYEEGLAVTVRAKELVDEAVPAGDYGMVAVIGLEDPEVREILDDEGLDSLCLVNSNNETSKIIVGQREPLDAFLTRADDAGALKALLLDVDRPYHHPHMLAPASTRFAEHLADVPFRRPCCPIVSSINQELLQSPESLKALTANNLSTPIDWQRVVEALAKGGIDVALECGAGISLTQNGRLITPSPRFVSLRNAQRRMGV